MSEAGGRTESSTQVMSPDAVVCRRRALVREYEAIGRWSEPTADAAYASVLQSLRVTEWHWVVNLDVLERLSQPTRRIARTAPILESEPVSERRPTALGRSVVVIARPIAVAASPAVRGVRKKT